MRHLHAVGENNDPEIIDLLDRAQKRMAIANELLDRYIARESPHIAESEADDALGLAMLVFNSDFRNFGHDEVTLLLALAIRRLATK